MDRENEGWDSSKVKYCIWALLRPCELSEVGVNTDHAYSEQL